MITLPRLRAALLFPLVFLAFGILLPLAASAQESPSGERATVKVEQVTPDGFGRWTLFYVGGSIASDSPGVESPRMHIAYPPAGNLTFTVQPPSGATASVALYEGDTRIKVATFGQLNAIVEAGKSYRLLVTYTYNKNGMLGVTSSPSSVIFRMTGPDGKTYRGKTPHTFQNIPAGQYTIRFNSMRGCIRPRPVNRRLEKGDRQVLHTEFDCTSLRNRLSEQKRTARPLTSRRSLINAVQAREQLREQRLRERLQQQAR